MQAESSSVRTHLIILGCIVAATALLRFAPPSVLANDPSCVFHTLFHLNCPFCGMTRDFTDILHGQKPHLNPFSWIAVCVIYIAYPALFFWAWSQQRLALFHQPAVHKAVAAVLVVMLVVNNLPY